MASGRVGRRGEGAPVSCVDASRDGAPAGMERLAAWAAAFLSTRASPNAWCGSEPRARARKARGRESPAAREIARRRSGARAQSATRARLSDTHARATDVGHKGSRRGKGDVRADPRRLFRVPAPQEGGANACERATCEPEPHPRRRLPSFVCDSSRAQRRSPRRPAGRGIPTTSAPRPLS